MWSPLTVAERSRWRPGCPYGSRQPAVGGHHADLDGQYCDQPEERNWNGEVSLAELLSELPVALLVQQP
jgi:hypothetical protein